MTVETEVLWLDEHRVVTLRELIEVSGLDETELLELVHSGALQVRETASGYSFSARMVAVARTPSAAGSAPALFSQAKCEFAAAARITCCASGRASTRLSSEPNLMSAGFVAARSFACAIADSRSSDPNSIPVRAFMGVEA